MRVYLDTCAIQRPLDDQSQTRIRAETSAVLDILALCASGDVDLIASGAHIVESAKCPYTDRREYMEDVLALSHTLTMTTPSVRSRASGYVEDGLKRLDAAHLAFSVEADADYFCTTDDRFLKRGRRLDTGSTTVVSPLELILALG